jgi:hypothetical protein
MARDWEATLRAWVKPPSDHEDSKRNKTEEEIKKALRASSRLKAVDYKVNAKGSYANNTNVRLDYDVDIAVECTEFCYHDIEGKAKSKKDEVDATFHPYKKAYGPKEFKADVEAALVAAYGRSAVTRGNMALRVREQKTTLPADVVPCCGYILVSDVDSRGNLTSRRGTRLHPDKGSYINNWPQQQYDKGVAKNETTGHRFKFMVRALKRLENELVKEGLLDELPSFFVECLVFNVSDDAFQHKTYVADMREVLRQIFNSTQKEEKCSEWVEVNDIKYLFRSGQSWTYQQAHALADKAWDYMGFE